MSRLPIVIWSTPALLIGIALLMISEEPQPSSVTKPQHEGNYPSRLPTQKEGNPIEGGVIANNSFTTECFNADASVSCIAYEGPRPPAGTVVYRDDTNEIQIATEEGAFIDLYYPNHRIYDPSQDHEVELSTTKEPGVVSMSTSCEKAWEVIHETGFDDGGTFLFVLWIWERGCGPIRVTTP